MNYIIIQYMYIFTSTIKDSFIDSMVTTVRSVRRAARSLALRAVLTAAPP